MVAALKSCVVCGKPTRYQSPSALKRERPTRYCGRGCSKVGTIARLAAAAKAKCAQCGKPFTPQRKTGGKYTKYCSPQCYGSSVNTLVDVPCDGCGKMVRRLPGRGRTHCCSKKCKGRSANRDRHASWRGGRHFGAAGWIIRVYDSPAATVGRDILEHRFLVEQAWGRKLDGTAEMVLYVNGDKRDNRLENLYVCKGHVEGHKIIKGSLPWPSAGNVHRAVPRQYTDKWGPSALRALDKITGGSEIGIYGYIKHKSDL